MPPASSFPSATTTAVGNNDGGTLSPRRVAAVAVGEIFVVSRLYQQETYRESLQLWNTPENIDANRRSPDPVYEEPAAPEVPDSLFTIDGTTHHADKQDADADIETETLFTD